MESTSLWKNRSFTLIWSSQVFSQIGEEFYTISLVWYLIKHSASAEILSLIAIPHLVAGLCFYMVGGIMADRYKPKSLMIISDLSRFLLVCGVMIAVYFSTIHILFFLAIQFFLGVFTTLFHPSKTVLIKECISHDQLSKANAISDTTFRTIRILAPMTVGWLGSFIPLFYMFLVNATCYIISAAFISALRERKTHAVEMIPIQSFFSNLSEGWFELRKNRLLLHILFFCNVGYLAWMYCWNVGFPMFAKEIGNGSPDSLGTLVSFYGIGNLLGSLMMTRIKIKDYFLFLLVGWAFQGIGFLSLSVSLDLKGFIYVSAAIAGFGGPLLGISTVTAIQNLSESRHIGKIFALNMVLFTIFSILSNTLGALWLHKWGVSPLFFWSGSFILLVCVVGALLNRRKNVINFNT